jgi:hypothetical protein
VYKRWQPPFDTILQTVQNVEFIKGIPPGLDRDDFCDPNEVNLLILDDIMSTAGKDPRITDLFTEGSHHRGLSVIAITQNIFYSKDPTQRRNCQYMVIFKNPSDMQHIGTFARQMGPTHFKEFMDTFNQATTERNYGYLLVDLTQKTPDHLRFRRCVLPGEQVVPKSSQNTPAIRNTAIAENGSGTIPLKLPGHVTYPSANQSMLCLCRDGNVTNHKRDAFSSSGHRDLYQSDTSSSSSDSEEDYLTDMMPACDHCGLIFSSWPDLQRHINKWCPEKEFPEVKRPKWDPSTAAATNQPMIVSHSNPGILDHATKKDKQDEEQTEDNGVFDTAVNKVYDTLFDRYAELSESYVSKDNMSQQMAGERAHKELLPLYREAFIKEYFDLLINLGLLKKNPIHRKVMATIEKYTNKGGFGYREAIQAGLEKRKYLFDDLFSDYRETENEADDEEDCIEDKDA